MRQHSIRLSPATDHNVERLTRPHTIDTEGHVTNWPALIDWISDAITEKVRRGGASSGEGDAGLNEGALRILRRIERGTASFRAWLYVTPRSGAGVKSDLEQAWATAHEYRLRGELDDEAWERIGDEIAEWVATIEAEWEDRPSRMELTVPCPECDTRWIIVEPEDATVLTNIFGNKLGKAVHSPEKRRAAVTIEYAEGRAPVALCGAAGCEKIWVGWEQIIDLGGALDATPDMAVLRACGIDLNLTDTPILE